MTDLLLALSVALAHAATNLDNLALLFALAPGLGARRALAGFALAQGAALAAAGAFGAGAAAVGNGWLGLLGLAPLTLGLLGLRRMLRGEDEAAPPPARAALPAATLLFLGCSADSFAVVAAFFADSAGAYDGAVAAGAAASLAVLCAIGAGFIRVADRAEGLARRLERLAPFALIASGLYILADTPTDAL